MQSSWILPIIIILAACTIDMHLADCPMEKVCASLKGSDLEYCKEFFKRKTEELPSCMCDDKYTKSADRKAVEYTGSSVSVALYALTNKCKPFFCFCSLKTESFSTFVSKCLAACKKATKDNYYQRRGNECRCRCPTLDDIEGY